jgi:hypothetical protein
MRPRVSSIISRPLSRSKTSLTGRPIELARLTAMRTLVMTNVPAERMRVPLSIPEPLTTSVVSAAIKAMTTSSSTSEKARPRPRPSDAFDSGTRPKLRTVAAASRDTPLEHLTLTQTQPTVRSLSLRVGP